MEASEEDLPSHRAQRGGAPRVPRSEVNVRPGKRQFDRHSGSGRGKENFKSGVQGGVKDELLAQQDAEKEEEEDRIPEEGAAPKVEEKKVNLPALPAARKAGEGVDMTQWKDTVPMERDDGALYAELAIGKKVSPKKKEEKKTTPVSLSSYLANSREGRHLVKQHDAEMAEKRRSRYPPKDATATTSATPAKEGEKPVAPVEQKRPSPVRAPKPVTPKPVAQPKLVFTDTAFPKLGGDKPAAPVAAPAAPVAPVEEKKPAPVSA